MSELMELAESLRWALDRLSELKFPDIRREPGEELAYLRLLATEAGIRQFEADMEQAASEE